MKVVMVYITFLLGWAPWAYPASTAWNGMPLNYQVSLWKTSVGNGKYSRK